MFASTLLLYSGTESVFISTRDQNGKVASFGATSYKNNRSDAVMHNAVTLFSQSWGQYYE